MKLKGLLFISVTDNVCHQSRGISFCMLYNVQGMTYSKWFLYIINLIGFISQGQGYMSTKVMLFQPDQVFVFAKDSDQRQYIH